MALNATWVEIPTGIEPDWSAAFAALDAMSDQECQDAVLASMGDIYDRADSPVFRDTLRASILTAKEGWAGDSPAMAVLDTSTGRLLISASDQQHVDESDDLDALAMFHHTGLAEAAGFGSMRDHVVAAVRQDVGRFIRLACKKYKYCDNEQVETLATDIEEGKVKP